MKFNLKRVAELFKEMTREEMLRNLNDIAETHELRRKGCKREIVQEKDADGKPIKNCHFPHIPITATTYARTHKMFRNARDAFGFDGNAEVWEKKLLLALEHIVRYFNHRISDEELGRQIKRLTNPLPKSEHIKRTTKTKKAKGAK